VTQKILINCSNLHSGGGVAVASSFIDCLSRLTNDDLEISLLLSSSVMRNLKELGTDTNVFARCVIEDHRGLSALYNRLDRYFLGMDLVFTVFGPAYYWSKRTRHLFGFAQPNIIYPNNPISASQDLISRIFTRFKYFVQAYFFSRADALVVELEHVKIQLQKISFFRRLPIYIVYSSVHSVFNDADKWGRLILPKTEGHLKLGIISRNYPHKNLSILPKVKFHLADTYGLNVDFFVTFQPDEWLACDVSFREQIVNVGGLSLSQCPTFYSLMDAVVFPSLLECFSAVPIEAMMVKKPLFASNLSFIQDVCGDYANYFEPLDPIDIARVVHSYFNLSVVEKLRRIEAAYAHVRSYPGPIGRAEKYIEVIKDVLIKVDK
jgi:glycosyltransferase involved in cell wall biosynthesis